jgi:UDP-N-acetylglucosamine acyltransferase
MSKPMAAIDPTARIESGAVIGNDVTIGPFCVIGANAVVEDGCRLVAHVHIAGHTRLSSGSVVYPFASLGTPPQSVKYKGGPTRLVIGPKCEIREHVTMNIGTEEAGGVTEIGARCFFMVGSHVAHDCRVGNDVTFANNATLGGHVTVGDNVFFGGLCAVHQFVRIGEGAMIAGMTGVAGDLIPFGYARGSYASLVGMNVVGMKRRGYSREDMRRLRSFQKELFSGAGKFADRLEQLAEKYAGDQAVGKVVTFIRESGSRPLLRPARNAGGEEGSGAA